MTTDTTRRYGPQFILLLMLLLSCPLLLAQKTDSSYIYKKIKNFAYKRRLTKLAYDAFFTEPKPIEYPAQPTTQEGKVINPYLKYENKVIRSVTISVFDPFGCSVNDTICKSLRFYERMGNRFHMRTKKWVINNKLLFKEHDRLNPLSVSESERLLRQSPFANDARIFLRKSGADSVDVHVIVLDKWSITVPAEASPQSANVRYRDYNLFGLGNQFEQYVHFTRPQNVFDYNGYYLINNIDNTYISSRLAYAYDTAGTAVGLSFDRPFYSPLAKWAGGLYMFHTQRFYPYLDPETKRERDLNLVNIGVDMWAGKSIKLNRVRSFFNQSTNIIVAERYYSNTYVKRPQEALTTLKGLDNESGFIGNIGYAIQEYYKDKYIYRFGANEDVPQGFILQFLYGVQKKEFTQLRCYAGAEIARAKHFDIGYLSASLAYGVFFNRYYTNDITTNFKLYYFSDLLRKGNWYFRQFFNYNLVHGQHKLFNETTTITSSDLYGFNSSPLTGHTKMVLTSETVAYLPYNVIGFKFAPVFSMGFGMLGRDQQRLWNSNIYQAYTLGIMLRNENLLTSTFQVSFGLYPYFPDGGTYILEYNPVTSFTLRVRVFAIGRPDFIPY